MSTSHDKPKCITLIIFLFKLLKRKERFGCVPQVFQLFKKAEIVMLQKILKMFNSLLGWSAWTKKVGKFDSWSPNSCVLHIQDDDISQILLIMVWVSEAKY